MQKADILGKILILEKTAGAWRVGPQWMRWIESITNSMDMNLTKFWEIVEDRGTWYTTVHGITKSWTQQMNKNKNFHKSQIANNRLNFTYSF